MCGNGNFKIAHRLHEEISLLYSHRLSNWHLTFTPLHISTPICSSHLIGAASPLWMCVRKKTYLKVPIPSAPVYLLILPSVQISHETWRFLRSETWLNPVSLSSDCREVFCCFILTLDFLFFQCYVHFIPKLFTPFPVSACFYEYIYVVSILQTSLR